MVKRIVFITNFKQGTGGGQVIVAYEMAHYFASHYDVAILCPGERTEITRAESGLLVFSIESRGDGNLSLPVLSMENRRRIFAFLDNFQPHVVHAHDPLLIGVVAQLWAKLNAVPYVFTSHVLPWKMLDFGASESMHIPARRLVEPLVVHTFARFYHACDVVTVMNRFAAEGMSRHGFNDRVYIIPNGRHLDRFTGLRPADLSPGERILTAIGFISRRKNQGYLLEVLKRLPKNYRLQLVGEVMNAAYARELEDFVEQNSLAGVHFTGPVAHADIPALLERSHLLVSASRMEVQSLVVIEALASGTPVVGLSNETIDELVDESVGVWLPDEASPDDFARAIERICGLPQPEYERMCRQARQRVQSMDWGSVMQRTIQAYEQILTGWVATAGEGGGRMAGPPDRPLPTKPDRYGLRTLALRFRQLRRVPGAVWLFAGINVLTSLFSRPFIRRPGA